MNSTFRKLTHATVYYIFPLVLILISVNDPGRELLGLFGNATLILLVVILFSKPLAVLFNLKILWKIVGYRRELGILTFWVFLFHGAGMIYLYNLYDPATWKWISAYIYWGLAGGIGIIILGITSNNIAVRLLKKNWKKIQYLSYFVLVMGLVHIALLKQEYTLQILIFVAFVILKISAWMKIKYKK